MKVRKQYWIKTPNLFGNPSYQECLGAHVMDVDRCSEFTQRKIKAWGHRVWDVPAGIQKSIDGSPDRITWVDTGKYKAYQGHVMAS